MATISRIWKTLPIIALVAPLGGLAAHAGELDGRWTTATGGTVSMYRGCGTYCGKVIGGEHNGKLILKISGSGGTYSGTVIDVNDDDKEYSGKLTLQSANKIKLKGCTLAIFCKTQYWRKQ